MRGEIQGGTRKGLKVNEDEGLVTSQTKTREQVVGRRV